MKNTDENTCHQSRIDDKNKSVAKFIPGNKTKKPFLVHVATKPIEHIVNLNDDPSIPNESWKVYKHQRNGIFKWNPNEIQLYLSEKQKSGKSINGDKLRKELEGKQVFNANLLDYLLGHPHLIPEDWEKDEHGHTRHIFFWGTIYRNPMYYKCLYVRYLHKHYGVWDWYFRKLPRGFSACNPAALRVN